MRNSIFASIRTAAFCILLFTSTISAADLEVDGVTYKDVVVKETSPDSITIRHSKGITKIFWERLPPALREKYGFSKEKADAYRETATANAANEAKGVEEILNALSVDYVTDKNKLTFQFEVQHQQDRSQIVYISSDSSRVMSFETIKIWTFVAPKDRLNCELIELLLKDAVKGPIGSWCYFSLDGVDTLAFYATVPANISAEDLQSTWTYLITLGDRLEQNIMKSDVY